jgi:Tfp pilus assembly protein PilF
MKPSKLGIFLFFLLPSFCSADILEAAVEEQRAGNHSRAAEHFENWLPEHADSEELPEVLALYFESVRDPRKAQQVLREVQAGCTNRENSAILLFHLAFLQEMTGNISDAQQMFEFSNTRSTKAADISNFFHSIRLLISMGEFGRAEAQTKAIITTAGDSMLSSRGKLFLSYITYLTGKLKEGERLLSETHAYIEKMSAADVYLFYTLSEMYGRAQFSDTARELLSSKYGGSIESAAAEEGSTVVIGPSLHHFQVSSVQREEEKENRVMQDSGTVRIQTGIFAKRDNAETLVVALGQNGFSAETVRVDREGPPLYKVVSPPLPAESSQEYILQLKEKGFEGFLLFP